MAILVRAPVEMEGRSGALILHEDEDLLVVNKPPGINTHAASPYAGEGLYDWLRRREPRWENLAILHRLDKETSGVQVFSKTRAGNVWLTRQFTVRRVEKEYVLWSDRRPAAEDFVVRSRIRKGAGRFESRSGGGEEDGLEAETRFVVEGEEQGVWRIRAEPRTGRTHQIRLHAADHGFPVLGDVKYGGREWGRLCLHARVLRLVHPVSRVAMEFRVEADFEVAPDVALRRALNLGLRGGTETDAYRRVHGAGDGHPGWYVDRLGSVWLASAGEAVEVPEWLKTMARAEGAEALWLRHLDRQVRDRRPEDLAPRRVWGPAGTSSVTVKENGLRFELSLTEGYSVGLFFDQRDNRRRLMKNWVGPEFPVSTAGMSGVTVLNLFAYTGGFSVVAAKAGARTVTVDLSKRYLDWAKRNFVANGLSLEGHEFLYGDAQDWLRRLAKKGRTFEVVMVDPPTFSQSREHGVFRVETDYVELATAAARVVGSGGVLFCSTNAARWEAEAFLGAVRGGVEQAGRRVVREWYVPQPPDFPTCREEPAYLKTVWMRLEGG